MKCLICRKEIDNGKIICSDNCNDIRLLMNKLSNKVTPTNGCDNCWGDLHQGCTAKCTDENKKSIEFTNVLYELVKKYV